MSRHTVVGQAQGHPHSSFTPGAFPYQLHNPHLVGVGYGERLAAAVVAIFLHQRIHHLDGLTSGARPLQGDVNQTAIVHNAGRVHQFGSSSECRLGDAQLVLIHVADNRIGLFHLGYLPQIFARIPLINVERRARRIGSCRVMIQFAIQRIRVGSIGHHRRPVGSGTFSGQKISTSPSGCRQQQTGSYEKNFSYHIIYYYEMLNGNKGTQTRSNSNKILKNNDGLWT